MFQNAGKYLLEEYTDTGDMIQVLPEDIHRRAIIFYNDAPADEPSALISFDDGNNPVELHPGVMWEPKLCPTNAIYVNVPAALLSTDPILRVKVVGREALIPQT